MKGKSVFNTRILRKLCTYLCLLIVCFSFSSVTYAHKACKAKYKGDLGELKGTNSILDDTIVAMASEIKVKKPIDTITKKLPPAIFFIIDHSGSMSQANNGNDVQGSRFRVTRDLLDTIKTRFDSLSEVGVAVFQQFLYFRPTNEQIFKTCPGWDSGSAIPLLNLRRPYQPTNTNITDKSGYGILRFYLDTAIRNNVIDLRYQPSPVWGGGNSGATNISTGFDAAIEAFKTSTITDKNRQFIIFLSDGEANQPQNDPVLMNKFIQGVNTPTTFTVFFTKTGNAPQNLLTMTDNIKKNGYSTKNPSSNIWAIQTDYPTLMRLLIDSVLNIMTQTIVNKPDSIVINGVQVKDYDTINGQFVFNSIFPLSGVKTDFNYKINYTKYKDTMINGVQQLIKIKDSTQGDFSVTVQNGVTTPDTFEVKCWDRDMGFYYNNNLITQINETMNQVEMRLFYDSGAARYNYTNATVELTTFGDGASKKDRDTFNLVKNGTIFSCVFPVEVNNNPVKNDGKIQVQFLDRIYAVFRNSETPKLPLDTLRDSIPFKVSGTLTVNGAYYYDTGGDGFIDSIYVTVDNSINADQVAEISSANLVKLPDLRKFTKKTFKYLDSKSFAILVEQDKAQLGEPTTKRETYDILITTQHIFQVGGWLWGGNTDIQDRIAPIIMSASAKNFAADTIKDTVWVNFSETVVPVTGPDQTQPLQPFCFIRHPASGGTITFIPTLVRGTSVSASDKMKFAVESYNNSQVNSFQKGDSIYINWQQDNVGDNVQVGTSHNYQRHEKNTRRPLLVDVSTISINSAYYFDTDGNGFVDSIYVTTDYFLKPDQVKEMGDSGLITLPDQRKFEKDKFSYKYLNSGSFAILVEQNIDELKEPTTYRVGYDVLTTTQHLFQVSGLLLAGTIDIQDRIAPILKDGNRAVVFAVDSIKDTLWVNFSETVNPVLGPDQSALQPFYFIRYPLNENPIIFKPTFLRGTSQTMSDQMKFAVVSYNDSRVDGFKPNDSIWINWEKDYVGDTVKGSNNYQRNERNTRRPLDVKYVVPIVNTTIISTTPFILNITQIPQNVVNIWNTIVVNQKIPIDNQNNLSNTVNGVIIQILPDSTKKDLIEWMDGRLSIYDAVGNLVVRNKQLGFNLNNKTLIYGWTGRNTTGRFVGAGTYLVIARANVKLKDQPNTYPEKYKIFIGVQTKP